MKTSAIALLFFGFGALCFKAGIMTESQIHSQTWEYNLEIINQDSVRVEATDTHRTYKVRFDQIDSVLIVDNL